LTLKVLRGQVAHANQRLIVSGERIRLSARALLRNRRDRFAGLEVRLKASKLSNAQAQRNVIAARPRARTTAGRTRPPRAGHGDAAPRGPCRP
jgi:exodeoxyribonuclease VII large subunit